MPSVVERVAPLSSATVRPISANGGTFLPPFIKEEARATVIREMQDRRKEFGVGEGRILQARQDL